MQHVLQAGLSAGMSATVGIHSSKPNPVPEGYNHRAELLPSDFVPQPFPEGRVLYRGKKHNVEASLLVVGAWPWGDVATFNWNDPVERPRVKAAWPICVAKGVNHIDTAQVYGDGESERITAELIAGMNREDVVVQTKWWVFPADKDNMLHPKNSPFVKLTQTLERMSLDYVDIYLVHGPIHHQSIPTVAKSLAECVDQGLTKCVGVANYSTPDMLKMQAELAKYDVPLALNQCEYSLLRRAPETGGLVRACKENGIVFQSYSSLAQGRLTGKYNSRRPPPKEYKFSSYPMEYVEPTIQVQERIAQNHGVSVSAAALNYNMLHGTVALNGIRNEEQAEQNCEAFGWRLTDEEIAELDAHSFEGKATTLWQQG